MRCEWPIAGGYYINIPNKHRIIFSALLQALNDNVTIIFVKLIIYAAYAAACGRTLTGTITIKVLIAAFSYLLLLNLSCSFSVFCKLF